MNKIKETNSKVIFSNLLFYTCFVLMLVLAIFRFCGIGYFANDYQPQECNPIVQSIILFMLKWFEMIFVLAMLSKLKWWKILLISFAWANVYWIAPNNAVVFVFDIIYVTIIPFIINKFSYKHITYGLIIFLLTSIYQFIMMQARYTINLDEKFNYIAGIVSALDYKLFIVAMYLFIYNRRLKMSEEIKKINTPNPEERNDYPGGHCLFFWGKFDKACEVIGKVIVYTITLGIAPLIVHCVRKHKNKKNANK